MENSTRWFHFIAWFFGGLFLANTVPHLVAGVSGSPFQSPFASPPGEGLSSSSINVGWGFANLLVGFLLVGRVGTFSFKKNAHVAVLGTALLLMWLMISRHFGRFHGGLI